MSKETPWLGAQKNSLAEMLRCHYAIDTAWKLAEISHMATCAAC